MKQPKGLLPKLASYSREHPLGYRIMVWVCSCSFMFILFSTALQLTLDYRREFRAIDQQVELIRSSYLASLAKSLWDVDQAQIKLQLKGIHNLPDVNHLILRNADNSDVSVEGPLNIDPNYPVQSHSFDLIHTTPELQRNLGQLEVSFDLKAIYSRIWQRGFSILLNQTLLVVLIVLVILIIFQRKITRHLEDMANYSRDIGAGKLDNSLTLNRTPPKDSDELDQLVTALNDMRLSIQQEITRREQEQEELRFNRDQLQVMVERRTESLLRAKEAAEEASNAKSRFLSTMSHEIRTPMNGMLGMIQLLESSDLSSKQRNHIQVLHDATNALLETFNNVLEYGRLVEGAYSVSPTRFSLHNLLYNLTALLSPEADRKKLSLILDCDDEVANFFQSEESSLRQILTNLLANAIKFTDSGEVRLKVKKLSDSQQGQQLRFEITDSGIGIETELQQHIFDRFTQADETITRRFGGTGLGLAICKELAEHLGGSIGLSSTQGQGTTFWLELDLALAQPETVAEINASAIEYDARSQKILLVEDVEINQQVVLGLLEEQQHQVTIASDGIQALELGQQQSFDLILMDMHLPGLSGLEVSARLNNDPECINHNTRIVALTASVRPEDIHSYLEAGISNVIAKPVQKEQLLQAIAGQSVARDIETDPSIAPLLDKAIVSVHQQMLGPEKLVTLMQGFCKVFDELWPALEQSIQATDRYDTAQQAHKLAGACDTIGFARASQLLRKLETDTEHDVSVSEQDIAELTEIMKRSIELARHWKENN